MEEEWREEEGKCGDVRKPACVLTGGDGEGMDLVECMSVGGKK